MKLQKTYFQLIRAIIPFFVVMVLVASLAPSSSLVLAQDNEEAFPGLIEAETQTGQAPSTLQTRGLSSEAKKAVDNICRGGSPSTWFTGCIVEGLFGISAQFLRLSGLVFDYFLWFTLNNNVIIDQSVVADIWDDLKDFANGAFILILIYLSYRLIIFGNQDKTVKDLIIRLIIIALVINFSLFITRVVIDASNITALTFYNAIRINDQNQDQYANIPFAGIQTADEGTLLGVKTISGAIVQTFNPARLLDAPAFNNIVNAVAQRDGFGAGTPRGLAFNGGARAEVGYGAILMLYTGFVIINILAGWIIFKSAFVFIARSIWLIILAILSPLAFVSWMLPKGSQYFKMWWETLVNRCFCLVVYLFFIWLILKIGNISQGALNNTNAGWREILFVVFIQFVFIYGLLKAAYAASKSMCDGELKIGGQSFSVGKATTSFAKRVGATAVPGLALRGTLGRAGYSMTQSARLSEMATSNNSVRRFIGNAGLGVANTLKDEKFGLEKGAAKRIDQRKDQLKDQMNRDAQNLKGSYKDGDGKIITKSNINSAFKASDVSTGLSGKDREDALKKFEKEYVASNSLKKVSEEEARDRAVTRARGSGIVGFVKSGALPISEREAAEEFEKKNKKDLEKRQKTTQIRDEVSQLGREAGIQENEIKNAARRAAAAAISENGDVDNLLATLFAKIERALETPDRNPDGTAKKIDVLDENGNVRIGPDGKAIQTIQKSINADTKRELEDSYQDVKEQIEEIKGLGLEKGEETRQIKEVLNAAAGIGTSAIKGNLRTEQNAVNARIRNVQDETQAFLDQVATGLAIDANIYGTGAETFSDDLNVGYEQRKREEDELRKEWLSRENPGSSSAGNTNTPSQEQTQVSVLEKKSNERLDQWMKTSQSNTKNTQGLLAMNKEGFERIAKLVEQQALLKPVERDMTLIQNEFKQIPGTNNLDFVTLSGASTEDFHDTLTNTLVNTTKLQEN